MGHSENINKNVYQTPRVLQELTHVGKHLNTFDKGLKRTAADADLSPAGKRKQSRTETTTAAAATATTAGATTTTTTTTETVCDEISQPSEGSKVEKKGNLGRSYYQWSDGDTKTVTMHFSSYIYSEGTNNQGHLPGAQSIIRTFLDNFPNVLQNVTNRQALIKTKIFNLRKKQREKAKNQLSQCRITRKCFSNFNKILI